MVQQQPSGNGRKAPNYNKFIQQKAKHQYEETRPHFQERDLQIISATEREKEREREKLKQTYIPPPLSAHGDIKKFNTVPSTIPLYTPGIPYQYKTKTQPPLPPTATAATGGFKNEGANLLPHHQNIIDQFQKNFPHDYQSHIASNRFQEQMIPPPNENDQIIENRRAIQQQTEQAQKNNQNTDKALHTIISSLNEVSSF
jgi:hypothetical protein